MNHTSRQSKRIFTGILLALLILPQNLLAQEMSSTNYKIPFQALGAGGTKSTSTNYIIEDTLSEAGVNATGEDLSSTNYEACAGYQCLREAGFITVVLAAQASACTSGADTSSPYSTDLGTLTTGSVSTASNHVCVTVTTNAGGGAVVQAAGTNAGLKSTSVPGDVISSSTASLSAGTEGFGICSTNAASGFTAQSPYDGTCNTGAGHDVGILQATAQTIFSASGPISGAYGDILTKAAISATTAAHDDYTETITLIITGTY